jgi:hypothetical protein
MKNKNLLIGGAVVVGGLLFFYLRKKRAESLETPVDTGTGSTEKGMGMSTSGSGIVSGNGTTAPTTTTTTTTPTPPSTGAGVTKTQLSKFEVDMRVFKDCGIAPPSFNKKGRNRWDDCKDKTKAGLRSQGLISFNGLSEDNTSRLDFDGNIVD